MKPTIRSISLCLTIAACACPTETWAETKKVTFDFVQSSWSKYDTATKGAKVNVLVKNVNGLKYAIKIGSENKFLFTDVPGPIKSVLFGEKAKAVEGSGEKFLMNVNLSRFNALNGPANTIVELESIAKELVDAALNASTLQEYQANEVQLLRTHWKAVFSLGTLNESDFGLNTEQVPKTESLTAAATLAYDRLDTLLESTLSEVNDANSEPKLTSSELLDYLITTLKLSVAREPNATKRKSASDLLANLTIVQSVSTKRATILKSIADAQKTAKIVKSDQNWNHRAQLPPADGDELSIKVEIKELKDGKPSGDDLGPEAITLPVTYGFGENLKIDYSVGLVATGLVDARYLPRKIGTSGTGDSAKDVYKFDPATTDKTRIGTAAYMHFHLVQGRSTGFAGTLGVLAEDNPKYLVGFSLFFGRNDRLVLTIGEAFGKVKRLDTYGVPRTDPTVPFTDTMVSRPFVGLSWNLKS